MSDGCRCELCFGLREWALLHLGKDYGLAAAPGHGERPELSAVKQACDGSYTCPCDDCAADKVRQSGGGGGSLPWEDGYQAAA